MKGKIVNSFKFYFIFIHLILFRNQVLKIKQTISKAIFDIILWLFSCKNLLIQEMFKKFIKKNLCFLEFIHFLVQILNSKIFFWYHNIKIFLHNLIFLILNCIMLNHNLIFLILLCIILKMSRKVYFFDLINNKNE